VLCWLLDEPGAEEVRRALAEAELVLSASLTAIECDRALVRAVARGLLSEALAAEKRAVLARGADHWMVFELDAAAAERARRPFPAEPIRTLDAVHLATAALAQSFVPGMALLSLDKRVRGSARQMGFALLPEREP
jgi:predicted nucleic acid-binding protein